MSYLRTMTTEQLAHNGFDVSQENPDVAICRLYPNLAVRHRCKACGNWSIAFNGMCPQCFIGKEPLKPTKQYFKCYTRCCADENCQFRLEAMNFLKASGMDTFWKSRDGFGDYISLDPAKDWREEDRIDFFLSINEFSVSNGCTCWRPLWSRTVHSCHFWRQTT